MGNSELTGVSHKSKVFPKIYPDLVEIYAYLAT